MLFNKSVLLLYYLTFLTWALGSQYPGNENGTCYRRVPYTEELSENISRGIVKAPAELQPIPFKKSDARAWMTIVECCEGFYLNASTETCMPRCEGGCSGGRCAGPNVCECFPGHVLEDDSCKPVCHRACNSNAYCIAPEVCACQFGYEEQAGVCRPVCRHDCRNGQCVAPRDCRCNPGYFLNETQHCEPVCESGCPHGHCLSPGVCACNYGYKRPPQNPETCVASCPESCANGECHSPGVCTCKQGYGRVYSDECIPLCEGGCANGRCIAPEQCECDAGFLLHPHTKKCVEPSEAYRAGPIYEGTYARGSTLSHGNYTQESVGQVDDRRAYEENQRRQDQTPLSVLGLNETRSATYSTESSSDTVTELHRDPYASDRTRRPQGPFADIRDYEAQRVNQKIATHTDNRDYSTQRPRTSPRPSSTYRIATVETNTDDFQNTDRPYGVVVTARVQEPTRDTYTDRPYRTREREQTLNHYGEVTSQRPDPSERDKQIDDYRRHYGSSTQEGIKNSPYRRPTINVQTDTDDLNNTVRPNGIIIIAPVQESTPDTYTNRQYRTREREREEALIRQSQMTSQRSNPSERNREIDDYRRNYGSSTQQSVRNPPYTRPTVTVQTDTEDLEDNNESYGIVTRIQGPTPSTYTDRPYRNHEREREEALIRQSQMTSQRSNPSERDREIDNYRRNYGSSTQQSIRNPPYTRPTVTVQTDTEDLEDSNQYYGTTTRVQEPTPSTYTDRPYRNREREREETLNRQSQMASQRPDPSERERKIEDYRRNYGYSTQQGVKNPPYRRPVDDQHRRRPDGYSNATRPTRPTYDPHERRSDSRYDRPLVGEVPSQPYGSNDPYNPHNRPERIEINRTYDREVILTHEIHHSIDNHEYTSEDVGTPVPNQHSSSCRTPCLNGDCIGTNQCVCRPGYERDPRNPYGSLCTPVCRGGCLNGVCSGPNLCLCNAGFTKESGIKSSQRCVPTN